MRAFNVLVASAVTSLAIPLLTTPAHAAPVDTLTEGFDSIAGLPAAGWNEQNLSQPLGVTNWFQGNDAVFSAQAGPNDSYAGANYNNTTGGGTISNWLLTPEVSLTKGSQLTFWTRTAAGSTWADRLEVRVSTNGASTDVGVSATDVGDFTMLEASVNPTLEPSGYPSSWTKFTVTLDDIVAPTTGRIALRYFVTDGGPTGANSNYIGIDTLSYETAPAVTSVAPDRGRVAGGTPVTIEGSHFVTGATATINGVTCESPTVTSSTTLTCTTGPGTAGTGAAIVTNPSGLSGTGGTFTYGTPGPLTFSPTPVDFGTVTATTTATSKVTVTNTGTIPLTPSAITASPGTLTVDADASTCAAGKALAPGGQCDVTLNWKPTDLTALSGSLTIAYPDGSTPDTSVQVIGTPVPPIPVAPNKPTVKGKQAIKTSWNSVPWATSYRVTLKGRKVCESDAPTPDAARRECSSSAAGKQLARGELPPPCSRRWCTTAPVLRTKTVTTPRATFKVALKPGTRVRVCVVAINSSGTSPRSCTISKAPSAKR